MSIAYFVCDANFWVDEGGLCFDQCDSMMLSGSFDRVGQWLLVGRMRRIVPDNTNHLPKRRAAYDDVSFIEPCRSPSLLPPMTIRRCVMPGKTGIEMSFADVYPALIQKAERKSRGI